MSNSRSFRCAICLPYYRTLCLLFLLLVLLVLTIGTASSQDSIPAETPLAESSSLEWASLEVTANPSAAVSETTGEKFGLPIEITNNGTVPAVNVITSLDSSRAISAEPMPLGDIAPGQTLSTTLAVDVRGRSATPTTAFLRVTADNVSLPSVVNVRQAFADLKGDSYVGNTDGVTIHLEQQYDSYDQGQTDVNPILLAEVLRDNISDRVRQISLQRLLKGQIPSNLSILVSYYPDRQSRPQQVPVRFDPAQLTLALQPPGKGFYLVEWTTAPAPAAGMEDGTLSSEEASAATAAPTEPDLPRGWTPTFNRPVVSDFTGSVTYQYPLLVPPGPAGIQPNLALTYNSAQVNGLIGRLQAGDPGFGWTVTALIDITQALETCDDNVCKVEADQDGNPNTYDPYNQYTLSFNGVGYELIHASGKASNGNPGAYVARGHAGLYIELCKAPFSVYCNFSVSAGYNTQSDVFWRIKSPDNTTYRLGYNIDSEQEIRPGHEESHVANRALQWRVDEVKDRFGNVMTYQYVEDYYQGYVHPEYMHTPANYLDTILYDVYKIKFDHLWLPQGVYRGYDYAVSWNTKYLDQITISSGAQQLRRYDLLHDFPRYGHNNAPGTGIPNQSQWCKDFNYVLNNNGTSDPDDDVRYDPDNAPLLLGIREYGSNNTSRAGWNDAEFSYQFLGTGEVDLPDIAPNIRYCFPHLDKIKTLYGPIPSPTSTPVVAYTYRAAQQSYQTPASYPSMSQGSVVNRWVNVVEKEVTNAGFTADAPALDVFLEYGGPNLQGDEDTFQGFTGVNRCYEAACNGAYLRKETLTFLAHPFAGGSAMLTGRMTQSNTYKTGNVLMARTDDTWGLLNAIGTNIHVQHPVLTSQKQTDYRGATTYTYVVFAYDKYANQTEVREYGNSTTTIKRTLERLYLENANPAQDKWLVNLVWRETLWDGVSNQGNAKIVRRTRYRYDGATCSSPSAAPTSGLLTAEDAYLVGSSGTCGADWITTTLAYGGVGGGAGQPWQITRVVDPGNRYRNFTWTDKTRLGSISDIVGTTYYAYSGLFRWLVAQVTLPNNAKTAYLYDFHMRLTEVMTPNPGNGAAGVNSQSYRYVDTALPFYVDEISPTIGNATTRTYYDALGRPLQIRRFNIGSDVSRTVVDTQYDAFGQVVCTTPANWTSGNDAFNAGLDCNTQSRMTYTYDALGTQTKSVNINGAETTISIVGLEKQVTDDLGNLFVYESDDLGRLIEVRQPVSLTMTYEYDLADNLTKVTGPNNAVTSITYDKLSRKTAISDPDMGDWTYAYDVSGNLIRQTDAKNQRICFYYDNAGRLSAKRHQGTGTGTCPANSGGTLLASYSYASSGAGAGLLQSVTGGTGIGAFSDVFTYDHRGRVTATTRTINGVAFSLSTVYDNADRITELSYSNLDGLEEVTYGYDGIYPKTLHSQKMVGNLVNNLDFNGRGQLTLIDRTSTGVQDTSLTYHNSGQNNLPFQILHGTPTDEFPDLVYSTYDPLDRLLKQNTYYTSTTAEVTDFTYDAVGRMLSEKRTNGPTGTDYHYAYTYGAGGNIATRTNITANPDLTRTYTYDTDTDPHAHALAGVNGDGMTANFINDWNGNMTTRTVNSKTFAQTFDEENRLEKVVVNGLTTEFFYDADGNRILTKQSNNTLIYTPFPEVERTVPTGGDRTDRNHYYLSGQLIAVRVKTESQAQQAFYYTYTDRQGSVVAVRKSDGAISGHQARYDAFGGYRTQPASTANPGISDRGYTGHRMNNTGTDDLELIYMNARYYVPEVGRFASPDTIVPDPSNPQSYNRYSYSYNDPVNHTDPTGHDPAWCNDPYDGGGGSECGSLVTYSVAYGAGVQWSYEEMLAVMYGAHMMNYKFMRYGYSFKGVYGGSVDFKKTGISADNLGEAVSKRKISVNEVSGVGITSETAGSMWAAHELGHAFNYALSPNTTDNLSYGQGMIDIALEGVYAGGERIAGSSTQSYADGNAYVRTARGYRPGNSSIGPYRQNGTNNASEDYADMMMNWTYNSFAADTAGAARAGWVDSHMPSWLSLAVSNNQ